MDVSCKFPSTQVPPPPKNKCKAISTLQKLIIRHLFEHGEDVLKVLTCGLPAYGLERVRATAQSRHFPRATASSTQVQNILMF